MGQAGACGRDDAAAGTGTPTTSSVLATDTHKAASRPLTGGGIDVWRSALDGPSDPFAEPLSLHELAARLSVSPFHLARVFRRRTWYSLHAYRTQLRLRLALERLPESRGALTSLAFELGFASHSHFTDTFRREFGVPPSVVRAAA